jgi:O-methyltransferase involved in polyketide biosynthesis
MAAMGRALHRDGPPPHVLDDWMAADLAGEGGRAILDSMLENAPPDRMHAFQAWTAVRSRFVEDFVESAVAAGISQYLMLGRPRLLCPATRGPAQAVDDFRGRSPFLAGVEATPTV